MLPRKRIFAGALVAALTLIFPLRVALGMIASPLTAPFVGGFVWGGRIVDARIAGLPLGDLKAGLSPLDLLIGRAKFWIEGRFTGALIGTFASSGVDVKALTLPVGRRFGAVTLGQLELSEARIRFAGDDCREASGRMQIVLAPSLLLGSQAGRYTGNLRCDGNGLASTMTSQSGMERLAFRIDGKGAYSAALTVRAADENAAAGLRANGFSETPSGFIVRLNGAF